MPRRRVKFAPGEFYHVYNRGVERRAIFFERENYLFFLRKVRQFLFEESDPDASDPDAPSVRVTGNAASKPETKSDLDARSVRVADRPVSVVAYCLMPNHFHLLVFLRCDDFSALMSSLQKSYTQAINRARGRVGPLFQGRFRAEHVDREEYLIHLSRYIHLNPTSARLVDSAGDWEFSSYREYVGLRSGSLVEPGIVLREFASPDAYRTFVEDGTSVLTPELRRIMIDM